MSEPRRLDEATIRAMQEQGEDLYTSACEADYSPEERVYVFLKGLQLALTACAETRLSGSPLDVTFRLAGIRDTGVSQIVAGSPFSGIEGAISALAAVTDFVDATIPERPLSEHVASPSLFN